MIYKAMGLAQKRKHGGKRHLHLAVGAAFRPVRDLLLYAVPLVAGGLDVLPMVGHGLLAAVDDARREVGVDHPTLVELSLHPLPVVVHRLVRIDDHVAAGGLP